MIIKEKKLEILFAIFVGVTFYLLWYGVTLPMVTITLNSNVDAGVATFNNDIIDTTRSVWGTIVDLERRERTLVAFLIFFFSVIIPILKSVLFSFILFADKKRKPIKKILNIISKWSMADVFVVAIFLAFLATDGQIEVRKQQFKVLGMTFNVQITAVMKTTLETGFYYFLSYCLISMLVFQSWHFVNRKKLPCV